MFGISAFINYTIAVAVWARFCFHVFLMRSCAICGTSGNEANANRFGLLRRCPNLLAANAS